MLALGGGAGVASAQPAATTYVYGARSNSAAVAARLAQAPSGFAGGAVTASDGEQTAPSKSLFTLRVVDPASGKELGSSTVTGRVKAVETSVCGERTLQVQVKRQQGSGSFSLAVARP